MLNMEIYAKLSTTTKPGISLKSLESTEKELDIILDIQYKQLLQLVNAPEFGDWTFFPIKDIKNLKKTFDDVVRNTKINRDYGLPKEYFVIAENGTGDYLCMLSNHPQIYYANHENSSLELVANDLKTFIIQAS